MQSIQRQIARADKHSGREQVSQQLLKLYRAELGKKIKAISFYLTRQERRGEERISGPAVATAAVKMSYCLSALNVLE